MVRYAFWNNKGGTGKTSLAFQAICTYAQNSPRKRILAIDLCPQANLSELLLGGLEGRGSAHLLQLQGQNPRRTIGGYFQLRLPSPYSVPASRPQTSLLRRASITSSSQETSTSFVATRSLSFSRTPCRP